MMMIIFIIIIYDIYIAHFIINLSLSALHDTNIVH